MAHLLVRPLDLTCQPVCPPTVASVVHGTTARPCSVNVEILGPFACVGRSVPNRKVVRGTSTSSQIWPCKMLSERRRTGNECIGSSLNIDPSMQTQHSPRPQELVGSASVPVANACELGKPPPPVASCSTGGRGPSIFQCLACALRFCNRGPAGWAIAVKATGLPASQAKWRDSPMQSSALLLGADSCRRGAQRLHRLPPRVTVVREQQIVREAAWTI